MGYLEYCKFSTCYNKISEGDEYCRSCLDGEPPHEKERPFSEQIISYTQRLDDRIAELESDVKRLKRELGLK